MILIGQKFENLLPYHTLHCGPEVIGFTAILKWSYRSAVVDHSDIVVLLLLLMEVERKTISNDHNENHSGMTQM